MPALQEPFNLGDLLKYEAPNLYSRDRVTVAAGQNLPLGTVRVRPDGGPGGLCREVEPRLRKSTAVDGDPAELPKIEPRGHKTLKSKTDKYTGIANQGPNSLRHFKRTFRETLRRQGEAGRRAFRERFH